MCCSLCCEIHAQPDLRRMSFLCDSPESLNCFAPYVVETCSQEVDSPWEERSANVPKHLPLGTGKKRGWPRRLVRPHTNSATFSEENYRITKVIMSRVRQDHC